MYKINRKRHQNRYSTYHITVPTNWAERQIAEGRDRTDCVENPDGTLTVKAVGKPPRRS